MQINKNSCGIKMQSSILGVGSRTDRMYDVDFKKVGEQNCMDAAELDVNVQNDWHARFATLNFLPCRGRQTRMLTGVRKCISAVLWMIDSGELREQ